MTTDDFLLRAVQKQRSNRRRLLLTSMTSGACMLAIGYFAVGSYQHFSSHHITQQSPVASPMSTSSSSEPAPAAPLETAKPPNPTTSTGSNPTAFQATPSNVASDEQYARALKSKDRRVFREAAVSIGSQLNTITTLLSRNSWNSDEMFRSHIESANIKMISAQYLPTTLRPYDQEAGVTAQEQQIQQTLDAYVQKLQDATDTYYRWTTSHSSSDLSTGNTLKSEAENLGISFYHLLDALPV